MFFERKEYLSLLSYSVTDGLHTLICENSLFLWIFEYLPAFVTVLTNNIIQNADINSFNTGYLLQSITIWWFHLEIHSKKQQKCENIVLEVCEKKMSQTVSQITSHMQN